MSVHFLGNYTSLEDVWRLFPNGGGFGDYIYLNGVRVDWDEYNNCWGDDDNVGGEIHPPEVVDGNLHVKGNLKVDDGVEVGEYIPGQSGAAMDDHGNAEFRTVNVDALFVNEGGTLVSLADFIKRYKTELPPDWDEYSTMTLFDDVRILVFNPNSSEKYYTTFGALKSLVLEGIEFTGGGGGTIEVIRSDDVGKIPTDNNVYSALWVKNKFDSLASDPQSHSHSNMSALSELTMDHIAVLSKLSLENNILKISVSAYSTGELSAFGIGGGGTGGGITIIDNLTSTATDAALSANMGRYLKSLIDNIEGGGYASGVHWDDIDGKPSTFPPSSHDHDTRYYTKSLTETKLSDKEDKANKKTAWSATPSDTNYPSEKLVKSSLDGKVPTTRKVNGKALSADVTLSASDVGAAVSGHDHDGKYVPTTRKINNKALSADITLSASDVGAAVSGHDHDGKYLGINATAAAATKLATARSIWGQSFDGTANVTGALSNVTNIDATGYVKVPKLDLGNGWTIEASTNELHFKLNGVLQGRFINGALVSSGELTAFN